MFYLPVPLSPGRTLSVAVVCPEIGLRGNRRKALAYILAGEPHHLRTPRSGKTLAAFIDCIDRWMRKALVAGDLKTHEVLMFRQEGDGK